VGALGRRPELDPALALLTLPVQPQPDLAPTCQRILRRRPDLIDLILPILTERFQGLSSAQLMATLGVSKDLWRHTPLFQEILAEGLREGRARGMAEGREKGMAEGRAEGREKGRVEGREEGREEGTSEGRHREALCLTLRQLERRFGPLKTAHRARVEALSLERLEELALALLDFHNAEELGRWLEGRQG
jgi:predicted transposase YdaD